MSRYHDNWDSRLSYYGEATLQLMRQLATCDLELFVQREMAESPATLTKKKNVKSVVWVYFRLTDDEKGVPVPW